MRYVLRWMRHLGAGLEQQVAMTFAVGYLSYYTASAPAGVSGQQSIASLICFPTTQHLKEPSTLCHS